MKNKYFGDINDYAKYGLLRALTGHGEIATTVCWMLTEDDDRTDGRRTRYLEQPEKWRGHDPVAYDYLQEQVVNRRVRSVGAIESADVLPNCRFYSPVVGDSQAARRYYLRELLEFARGSQLVFFDPDNGIEVKSVLPGRRNSSKYLYWDDVRETYAAGYSLLIYQHLPRKPRAPFIRQLASMLISTTGAHQVYSYRTARVVFFLIPQVDLGQHFKRTSIDASVVWGDKIKVDTHRRQWASVVVT